LVVPTNSESNGHVSGDHTDNENEDSAAEQRLLDADDEVVDTDEQVEGAAIERLLGAVAEPEETPPSADDESPAQRRLEARRRRETIAKFTAVNLGREVSDPDHIGTYEVEARRHIDDFKHDWNETVAERVSQASSLAYPLHPGSAFNLQSWTRLRQLGVDRIWQIVDAATSNRVKEVLGRRKFGRREALALPKLREVDQFKRAIYIDHVQDDGLEDDSLDGLYVGSATGPCGTAGRWVKYDKLAAGGGVNDKERDGLHLSSGLEPTATMHLRPLMIFEDLDASLVLLMEGLVMDFLGTIDRSSTRTIRMGVRGREGTILHSPTLLEASKRAFPSQRQSPDFKGLNAVSALKQMGKVKLPFHGCPMGSPYCDAIPTVMIAAGAPQVVCSICSRLWWKWLKDGRAVADDADIWEKWVVKRKETQPPFAQDASVVHTMHEFECAKCHIDHKTAKRLRDHNCRACRKCGHVLARIDQVAPHVAKCEGVWKDAGRKTRRSNKNTCDTCGETFTAASSLERHEIEQHQGNKVRKSYEGKKVHKSY
jgi:hypothetical protein